MIIADSDVLIDTLRGQEPIASLVAGLIESRTLATTAISCFELMSGAAKISEAEWVDRLLRPIEIFEVDENASRAAAKIRRELEAAGKSIGMADYLIAGICLSRQTPLLTRNRKHFSRVPDLLLTDLPD